MITTFRIGNSFFDQSLAVRELQDDAFRTWQGLVEQKVVALASKFGLDPIALRGDIQDWFKQYNAKYRLSMRFGYVGAENTDWDGMECITEIDIFDEEVALLFKLTWIGV